MVRKIVPPTERIPALRGLSSKIHSRIWRSYTRRLWLQLVHQEAAKSTVTETFRPLHVSLFGNAGFIFQQDLAPAHAAKGTKTGSVTMVLQFIINQQTPLTWSPKKIQEFQICFMKDTKHVLHLGRKFSEKILHICFKITNKMLLLPGIYRLHIHCMDLTDRNNNVFTNKVISECKTSAIGCLTGFSSGTYYFCPIIIILSHIFYLLRLIPGNFLPLLWYVRYDILMLLLNE